MAYQQSELVNVLGLETVFIRGPDNYPISSQYVLYANGFGQGYWSNAVLPENLSTLSTALGSTNIYIAQLSTGQAAINQSTLSTTDVLQSTVSTSYEYSISTANATFLKVDSWWQSSINYTNSTVLGISTVSTFYSEISSVQSSVNASASSLSTAIYVVNLSTYNGITLETNNKINTAAQSNITNLGNYSNFVSTNYATISSLSTAQGYNASTLVSTGNSLYSSIYFLSTSLSSYVYETNSTTFSTFSSIFSTLSLQSTQIAKLQAFSTGSYSTNYFLASSLIVSSQAIQDSNLAIVLDNLQVQITNNSSDISANNSTFLNFQSTTISSISSLTNQVSTISDSLSSLWFNFELLSMSSILSSIYTSFYNLENYSYNLYSNTSTSVSTSVGYILYSTNLINQSIANAFFNSNVSSVYASTVSTVVPSTMAYVSSLISTLYSSLYYNLNSTLLDTVYSSLTSTTYGYLSTVVPSITSQVNSSFVTEQVLLLSNTSSNVVMNFSTYRNFYINVNNLTNGTIYKISYLSNAISSLNYNRGVITIDISTVGNFYSTNSSLLVLETNHYGYPTTTAERYIPYISNADYTMQYEYTILNQIIYTNLLGVYPRLNVTSIGYSTISTLLSVYINNVATSNFIWRNTPIAVNWTTYGFYPFSSFGGPAFNPQVQLTYNVNSTTVQTYGPYSFSQSTAVIQLPVISSATSAFVSTSISAYIVGKPTSAVSKSFVTILPAFNTVLLSSLSSGVRISGNKLAGITASGSNSLSNYGVTVSTATTNNALACYSTFVVANLLNTSLVNANFVGPSNVSVVPAIALISSLTSVNSSNAFSSIIYSNCTNDSASTIAPSTNAAFQQVIGIVNDGATRYSRILQLTSSPTTTFAL